MYQTDIKCSVVILEVPPGGLTLDGASLAVSNQFAERRAIRGH